MRNGVVLSPKHGLNPSMGVCELCQRPTGELLLLGRMAADAEAPRYVAHGWCDECEKRGKEYVAMLVCTAPGKRTGELIWLRRSAFAEVFSGSIASAGLRSGVVECESAVAEWLKRNAEGGDGLQAGE